MLSVKTSRQPGITGSASLSVRRYFAAAALPKQNPFFAKACAALREIHGFSLAFGSVSKLRDDLQTPVGFSVSLQPHGVVEIRPAHSTSRTSNYVEPERVTSWRRKSLSEARMLLPVAAAVSLLGT
jgi:hypothetical protein